MKVCVIGAGICGLTSIKACQEEGLDVICFERSSEIGGLWNYRPNQKVGATVMASTVINTSKEMMAYSDFPPPPEFPNFMHHKYVQAYLRLYADKFNLLEKIRFNSDVKSVSQLENDGTGRGQNWRVLVGNCEHIFDAVLVCTGHHSKPYTPHINGIESFSGVVLHSHDYRDCKPFENKRIFIVGIGNSGLDIAVELAKVSKKVTVSTRRGTWIFNRVAQSGLPYDVIYQTRFYKYMMRLMPWTIANDFMEYRLMQRMDHELYGLKPQHRFFQQHPAVNDSLANLLASGMLEISDDIECINTRSVTAKDGREHPVDVIILCTGYIFDFPFLQPPNLLQIQNNEVDLYKFIFPPGLDKIAIIGLIQPIGSVSPICELQARWVAGIFSGHLRPLPTEQEMRNDIVRKRAHIRRQYFRSQKHTFQVDFIAYCDELAELVGCRPAITQVLRNDPKFALRLFFGPNFPYVYRLEGPRSWSGARDAIIDAPNRVKLPLKQTKIRSEEFGKQNSSKTRKGAVDHWFQYATSKCLTLYFFVLFFGGILAFCGTPLNDGFWLRGTIYGTFCFLLSIVLSFLYIFLVDLTIYIV